MHHISKTSPCELYNVCVLATAESRTKMLRVKYIKSSTHRLVAFPVVHSKVVILLMYSLIVVDPYGFAGFVLGPWFVICFLTLFLNSQLSCRVRESWMLVFSFIVAAFDLYLVLTMHRVGLTSVIVTLLFFG